MPAKPETHLSRRERQIMDIIYAGGPASVSQVRRAMADPPSYSAVRALMRILEQKGHLRHKAKGNKYIYLPTRSRQSASRSAARRLLRTFFDGSTEQALAALLDVSPTEPTPEELDRLARIIENARKEGR
jgi:predicted transcriptional regulator